MILLCFVLDRFHQIAHFYHQITLNYCTFENGPIAPGNRVEIRQNVSLSSVCLHKGFFWRAPQRGAADAEIKVPSAENTELKGPPLKPGVGQYIATHAMLTARGIHAYHYRSTIFVPENHENQ